MSYQILYYLTTGASIGQRKKLRLMSQKIRLNVETTSIMQPIPQFSLDQNVRIALEKTTFSKGYTPNWSAETFQIAEVLQTDPPTYKIKHRNGEIILGSYYEPELQGV